MKENIRPRNGTCSKMALYTLLKDRTSLKSEIIHQPNLRKV